MRLARMLRVWRKYLTRENRWSDAARRQIDRFGTSTPRQVSRNTKRLLALGRRWKICR